MFSGIVRGRGEIVTAKRHGDGVRLGIRSDLEDLEPGSSVAVNGVCLTVVAVDSDVLVFDAVGATLERTLLGRMNSGDHVNLEPSLRVGSPMDGHLVTGHVDGIGHIASRETGDGAVWFRIVAPAELLSQIALRGSVAVDGVSLTVAGVEGDAFRVSIVPYTLEMTLFGVYEVGRPVHLETDVLAKYVERALAAQKAPSRKGS
ncbi:MAG TPA: riboflavin synthase [Candidatus Eisenbacteria bacterium]|nr:riboflavin synthase [Candidatus Eisenbacteria bacterium]